MVHAAHVAPPVPQKLSCWAAKGTHPLNPPIPPAQQPLGQLVASQMQVPPSQAVPWRHWNPVPPQLQPPPAEQVLERVGSHEAQLPPPAPHVGKPASTQVDPTQQEVQLAGQVPHVPSLHV